MMIELEPETVLYKDLEKWFENRDLELIGTKYVNDEPFYVVRKILK